VVALVAEVDVAGSERVVVVVVDVVGDVVTVDEVDEVDVFVVNVVVEPKKIRRSICRL
jgi:hypothetical protein